MSWLLHLSDLHLGVDADHRSLSDDKAHVIPKGDLQLRSDRLRSTLTTIAHSIETDGLDLDCIVITGDVADKNSAQGYRELPELLSPLVPGLVPSDRVVVVPGNHDVAKNSPPSSAERYERFLKLRAHGYLTPLLEGIDIDSHGMPLTALHAPILLARDKSFIVAALNSANHSQSPPPADDDVSRYAVDLDRLRARHPAVEALWKAWAQLGESDPSWVGEGQRRVVTEALAAARREAPLALRVLALHHQLLPAGPAAEVKPYETMLNLGEVLEWITDNQIDVALHGHKHAGRVSSVNQGTFAFDTSGRPPSRTLIVSAPAGTPEAGAQTAIARLVRADPTEPRVAGVRVTDVVHVGVGAVRKVSDMPTRLYVLDSEAEHGLVRGETAQQVHRKLMALGDRLHPLGMPLTCHIEQGETALQIPETYPELPTVVTDRQEWFSQAIRWWQAERATPSAAFNHGERIRGFLTNGHGKDARLDQLKHAFEALKSKGHSTRAIAVLIDPARDLRDPAGPTFPAFALAQFAIREDRLHVTAYFRKQEIPHWWPVNAGELAALQAELIALLLPTRAVTPGSITTITPQAVRGGSVPRVSIPSLDQLADHPFQLLDLVLPLFGAQSPGVAATRGSWQKALEDWDPTDGLPADGDPMPVFGLTSLCDLLQKVIELEHGSATHRGLLQKINTLRSACVEYESSTGSAARGVWVKAWRANTKDVLEAVDDLLAEPEG